MSQIDVRDGMHINFDSVEVITDPFPVYEQIRERGQVVWNERLGVWMVVGHEALNTALHDPTRFSNAAYTSPDLPGVLGEGVKIMINTDPPESIPYRKVAQQAFLRSTLAKMDTTIMSVVDELLDGPDVQAAVASGEPLEMMQGFCQVVPGRVIALLLGVAVEDMHKFIDWSDDLTAVVDTGQRGTPEWPKTLARAEAAGQAMREYLQEQIDDHRANPRDDLINDLLEANGNGILNDGELLATCILLLIAGNETTTKLIAASLRILPDHPEQRQAIVDDPAKIVDAIEEVLRYEGVTTIVPRLVTQDTELDGVAIAQGEVVLLMLGAANRDAAAYEDPTRFDISRSPNHHMAFGHGVHHCLGNRLARMEAQIAVGGFLRRFPKYEVVAYSYKPVFLARGLDHLSIRLNGPAER